MKFKSQMLEVGDWADVKRNEHNAWIKDGIEAPTDEELQAFLENLDDGASGEQSEALRYIGSAVITDLPGSPKNTIAYQTALRARVPECVWQGPYGFCGPAAIAYYFAKHWPRKYAQCVVELQNIGVGRLYGDSAKVLEVHADKGWNEEYDKAGTDITHMGPADFLLLHAIRRAAERHNSESFLVFDPGRRADATHPSEMKSLLERAGYREVQNRTFWNPAGSPPEKRPGIDDDIKDCERMTRDGVGPLVIMLSDAWLSTTAENGQALGKERPKTLSQLHWICVNSLAHEHQQFQMNFMSYGAQYTQTYRREDFRRCFYGFISAKP